MEMDRARFTGIRYAEIAVLMACSVAAIVTVYGYGAEQQGGVILLCMGTDVLGIVVASILFAPLAVNRNPSRREEIFMLLFVLEGLTLLSDILSWFIDGHTGNRFIESHGRYLKNTLLLTVGAVFWIYLNSCIDLEQSVRKRGNAIVLALFVAGMSMLLLNGSTGCLFFIRNGMYCRGDYLFVFYGLVYLMLLLGVLHVLRYSRSLREKVVAVTYMAISLVMLAIQYFKLGLSLIYVCPLIILVFVYVNFYITQQEKSLRRESEIQAEKHDAMITQIQPHFLYNALTSIMAIKGNPPETQDAICDFSKYLRENLASTERSRPIPFRHEVQHVETYLALEKLRFKEKLDFVIDTPDMNFPIPSLAL